MHHGRPERTPNARQPNARQVALAVLRRIEDEGAYANLALGPALQQSQLGELDRKFVTELVYGTTRMRRACDALVDRFVASPPDPVTRSVLRLGAYQLAFAGVPPHAAVGETVGLAPKRTRGLVNAVLRKVSRLSVDEQVWPSDGARLSYPDWIVDTFRAELGDEWRGGPGADERAADRDAPGRRLHPGRVVAVGRRRASRPSRGADLRHVRGPGRQGDRDGRCPRAGAVVIAGDNRPGRARLVRENAATLDLPIPVVVADGAVPPFRPGRFDAVLLDAPCSGLGALRRRADARWRITANDVVRAGRPAAAPADVRRRAWSGPAGA